MGKDVEKIEPELKIQTTLLQQLVDKTGDNALFV
jgi:hypothetical protein